MKRCTCAIYALLVLVAVGSCGFFGSPAQAQGTASQSTDPALQKWQQFGQNKANQAKAAAANVTAAEKEQARTLFATAFDLAQQQNYDAARIAFQRGLAIDPTNAQAEYYLAEVFMQSNDVKSALPHYAVVMALAPTSPEGIKAEAALTQAVTKIQAAQQASQQAARQAAAAAEERRRQQAADEERRRQEAMNHLVCATTSTWSLSQEGTHGLEYIDVLGQDRVRIRTYSQEKLPSDRTYILGGRFPSEPNFSYTITINNDMIKVESKFTYTDVNSLFSITISSITIDRTTGTFRGDGKVSYPNGQARQITLEETGSCQEAHSN